MKRLAVAVLGLMLWLTQAQAQIDSDFHFDEQPVPDLQNPYRALEEADTLSGVQQPGNGFKGQTIGSEGVVSSKFGDPNFWCEIDPLTQQPKKCVVDENAGINYNEYSARNRNAGGYVGTNSLQNFTDTSNAMAYVNAKVDTTSSAGVIADSTFNLTAPAVGVAIGSNAQFSQTASQAAVQAQDSIYSRAALDPQMGPQNVENYDGCMRKAMLGKSALNGAGPESWMAAHDRCMGHPIETVPSFQARLSGAAIYWNKASFKDNPNHLLNNERMLLQKRGGTVNLNDYDKIYLTDFIFNQEIDSSALDIGIKHEPDLQLDSMANYRNGWRQIFGDIQFGPAASDGEKFINPLAASGNAAKPIAFPEIPEYKGPEWYLRKLIADRWKNLHKLIYYYCNFQKRRGPQDNELDVESFTNPVKYGNQGASYDQGAFWNEPELDALLRKVSLKEYPMSQNVIHALYFLFRSEYGSNGDIKDVNCKLLNPEAQEGPDLEKFIANGGRVNYLSSMANCKGVGCVSRAATARMRAIFKISEYIGYGKFLGTAIQARNQIEFLSLGVVDRSIKELATTEILRRARSRDLDGDYAQNLQNLSAYVRELLSQVDASLTGRGGIIADTFNNSGSKSPGIAAPGRGG